MKSKITLLYVALVASCFAQTGALPPAGDKMSELATKLNNPAASLISVPLQSNVTTGALFNHLWLVFPQMNTGENNRQRPAR